MATISNVHDKALVDMRLICVIIIFNGMTNTFLLLLGINVQLAFYGHRIHFGNDFKM